MAARPGDWSALGMGSDPTPGDPATLKSIADAMRDLADSAGTINNGLRELQITAGDGQRFIGKTADALRDVVDEHLHRFVGRVEESFRIAEGALRTYATIVTNAQAEADQALSAAQGMSEDDPARETMKERAHSAASDVSTAATNLRNSLHHAGTLMVQPVSDCDLFWEVFQWLTIIISVIAVFTGGILGIIAWGMNAALLIKTIVDFSQGKAGGLELGLAFLGVLFPSTKGINVGQLVKGLGNTLKGGASGIADSARALTFQAGNIARLTGLPRFVVVPVVVGAKIGASLRFDLSAIGRGIITAGQNGWKNVVVTVRGDWARATVNASGSWGRIGAYTVVNVQRLGRFTVAALAPLNFAEMSVLGIGGAARLAFGERVLGIAQPELHALLVNAGRAEAVVRGGSTLTHVSPGALVPVPPLAPPGVRFGAGGFSGVPSPGGLFRPGAGAGFTGTADLVHLSMTKLPTVNLGSLGFGGLDGMRGLPGLGAHAGPGTLTAPAMHGLGGGSLVGGVPTPGAGVHVPGGFTMAPPPGTELHLPAAPHGMTTAPSGLSIPGGLPGGPHLVAQTDLAGGQVRLDSNLLVNGHTSIDLLRDAHTPAPLAHTVPRTDPGVHPGAAGVSGVPVAGVSDGVSMARGAVGYAEDLDGLTFGELHALSLGDVSVTGIRADGISLRIGDAPVRTMDAHSIAATAPVGPAPVSHVPGTGAVQPPGVGAGTGAAAHAGGGAVRVPGTGEAHLVPNPAGAVEVPGSGLTHAAPAPATGALHVPGTSAAHGPPATAAGHAPATGVRAPDTGAGHAVPPVNAGAKVPGDGVPVPGRGVPGRGAAPPPAAASAAAPPPAPALNPQELALSLLRGDGPAGPPPVTHGVRAENVTAVSARPALDTAGAAPRGAADAALDLVARPGRTGGPDLATPPPASATHTPAPTPAAAAPHSPVPAGDGAVPVPASAVPAPPPTLGGKGRGPAPASQLGGDGLSGPTILPTSNKWGGRDAAIVMNRRFHAAHQVVIGNTSGFAASARVNGWASYEQALSRLGQAEKRLDEVAPPPGVGPSSGPTPAHRAALDDYARAEQAVDRAEDTLRRLGMDPVATHREIRSVIGRIFTDRGGFLLGGAPTPRRLLGDPPPPAGTGAGGGSPPGVADDAMDVDVHEGVGAHPSTHTAEAVPAAPVGGVREWTPPGAGQGADGRLVLVNFPDGHPGQTTPLTGTLDEEAYLNFVRESVAESRPLGFVVNAIVRWDGLANGGLQRFLDTVGTGLHEFDGRVAVVIGVNGPEAELAAIGNAMHAALKDARFPHPVALVRVPYKPANGSFPYGTVRNAVLESTVGGYLARTMMECGLHPYFSIMDFDFHPHVVPDGRHVFNYFEETLCMPDHAAVRAAGQEPEPPLRPLMMAGGYRAPDLTAEGATSDLLKEANARIAKDFADAAASGKGKGKGGPKVITEGDLPGLFQRIERDMSARTRLAMIHPQLPYAPEPNLFVDAAATMLRRQDGEALSFGDGAGEFAALGNRLNQLNAWELNRRLPLPAFTVAADDARNLLRRAADSLWPGGVGIPKADQLAARDVIRQLADSLDGLGEFKPVDANRLRSLAESFDSSVPPHGKAPATTATPKLLNRAIDALDTRLAERAIAAGNNTLPERGAAFVNDVQGAAVPTDVARLIAGAKGRTGKLPQDHGSLKNPMGRLVGPSRADQGGLHPANHRDEWTGSPGDPPGDNATGVPTGDDPLFPNKHAPRSAPPVGPAPGVHDHPGAPPPTRIAGKVSGNLDSRLGSHKNPPTTAVSARVPGADGLHAGISPDELRLAMRDLALSNDPMALLRRLRYLREEHLGPGAQLPQPRGSLFAALKDAALDPQGLLRSTLDGLDKPYPRAKPMPTDVDDPEKYAKYAKKLFNWRNTAKNAADKNLEPVIDDLGAKGIGVEDFFTRLAQGHIHPPSDTLQGFIRSRKPFAMDPGGLLVLKQYAAALRRDIHVTGGDGFRHEVKRPADAGRKRPRDGESEPLILTWEHGSGWRVGPPQAASAPPAPASGGPGAAGHPGQGDSGRAGYDGPPPPKRPRRRGGAGEPGPSTVPAPSVPGPARTTHQQNVDTAWQQYLNASGELIRATRDLDPLRARAGESSSGSRALEAVTSRAQEAESALNRAERLLEQLGVDMSSHRMGRLQLGDSPSPPGRPHHPSDGGTP
ncbi:putative T7SS-secreted protein [Streptomyces sp. NPDC018000]|uniref:putative T7SS-secreted protein n=1 Tax=Streptomyces sp. NPDC018000 TaxID=3365028 RepID=UPI0037B68A77